MKFIVFSIACFLSFQISAQQNWAISKVLTEKEVKDFVKDHPNLRYPDFVKANVSQRAKIYSGVHKELEINIDLPNNTVYASNGGGIVVLDPNAIVGIDVSKGATFKRVLAEDPLQMCEYLINDENMLVFQAYNTNNKTNDLYIRNNGATTKINSTADMASHLRVQESIVTEFVSFHNLELTKTEDLKKVLSHFVHSK